LGRWVGGVIKKARFQRRERMADRLWLLIMVAGWDRAMVRDGQ